MPVFHVSNDVNAKQINDVELNSFRQYCRKLNDSQLSSLFNKLSAREREADLLPSERDITETKRKIVGQISFDRGGHGAMG